MLQTQFAWGAIVLLTTSSAYAADAIVAAEPEPATYVSTCKEFGNGYFYIPGTETCLRVGGVVRQEMRFGGVTGGTGGLYGGLDRNGDLRGDGVFNRTRFSLQTYTATDTEYGPLKTFTEVRFTSDNGVAKPPILKFAVIEFAGFRMGKDDSAFVTFPGYAGNVIADDLIPYGVFDTQLLTYTYKDPSGFSAVASLESGNSGEFRSFNDAANSKSASYAETNITDVVAGLKYAQGWGDVSIVGAYDRNGRNFVGKLRGTWKPTADLMLFAMGGLSSDHDDGGRESGMSPWGGSWAAWTGFSWKINPKLALNTQFSVDEFHEFAAVANVTYDLVKGLRLTPEVEYKYYGDYPLQGPHGSAAALWSGMLRINRSF
jgi:hypothetical protein